MFITSSQGPYISAILLSLFFFFCYFYFVVAKIHCSKNFKHCVQDFCGFFQRPHCSVFFWGDAIPVFFPEASPFCFFLRPCHSVFFWDYAVMLFSLRARILLFLLRPSQSGFFWGHADIKKATTYLLPPLRTPTYTGIKLGNFFQQKNIRSLMRNFHLVTLPICQKWSLSLTNNSCLCNLIFDLKEPLC